MTDRPHLTDRHRHDPGRRTKPHRNAALDLALHQLTVSEGATREGRKLWGLTTAGLQAAAQVLDRPLAEMGSTARGAAAHGAAHAMAVNATVQALLQPQPHDDQAAQRREGNQAVLEAAPPGLGRLESIRTQVPLPITGSEPAPGPGSPQADLVLRAPEHELPVAFVEVDRATITPARLAQKANSYHAHPHRQARNPVVAPALARSRREPDPDVRLHRPQRDGRCRPRTAGDGPAPRA